MTIGLMRNLTLKSLARAQCLAQRRGSTFFVPAFRFVQQQHRGLAKLKDQELRVDDVWFSSSVPRSLPSEGPGSGRDHQSPDERTLKLGKTIRILQERLPSLLISPLPQEILSPHITLQLFPSTHPHLPTVSGKIAYTAALWTSPMAWGRLPVLGNVKLVIMSERMVKNGPSPSKNVGSEKLIVRWKTCPKSKTNGVASSIDKITEWLGGENVPEDKVFHGLFLFEFDEEGRILTHVIEHAEEGNDWERTAKVISVTDWLLGRAWGKKEEEVPGLALGYCDINENDNDNRRHRDGK